MTPAEQLAKKKSRIPARINVREQKWRCKLNEKRNALNLTLRDIEGATGVTSATLSCIERGAGASLAVALKICQFFECTVEEMWPETVTGEKWPTS